MIFAHYSEVDMRHWRWEHFPPDEPYLACPCCGQLCVHEPSMDMLQRARTLLGRPIRLNSGHRCAIHNARVGGAALSQHKKVAFDISLWSHGRRQLLSALSRAGFSTFGFYRTFVHADIRPGRRWFSKHLSQKEITQWKSVISLI
jgi:hypothetical protein